MSQAKRIANFLFEIGTMRKLLRIHRQLLMTDDLSDNIASHSYRVAMIGWFLAKEEKVHPYKVVMMCLLHDTGEVRSGDHNYLHKRYIKVFEEEIIAEQLGSLPDSELKELAEDFLARKTNEAIIAKDADLLDQVLLLREYEWQGNQEAKIWLRGKGGEAGNNQVNNMQTKTAKKLAKIIMEENPSSWWNNIWTNKNR
jgi:putative hydrolases of HD superfamily